MSFPPLCTKMGSSANGHWLQEIKKNGMHKLMNTPLSSSQCKQCNESNLLSWNLSYGLSKSFLKKSQTQNSYNNNYLQPKNAFFTYKTTSSTENDINDELQATARYNEISNLNKPNPDAIIHFYEELSATSTQAFRHRTWPQSHHQKWGNCSPFLTVNTPK